MEGEDLVIHGMSGVDPHSHFEVLDSNSNNIYTLWSSRRPFMA